MTERADSYRRILFATAAVGGASVLNILLGILRLKVAALVLGTAGIGLISLLQSVIATGAAVGGLGISQSAMRQIAASRAAGSDQPPRQALFIATGVLALASGLLVWAFRRPIAMLLLGNEATAGAVGWMALGSGLTIIAGSQSALLAGLGRVADVARVSLLTACLSTVAAISFLLLLGEQAILPYLLGVPVASSLVGWFYAARAQPPLTRNLTDGGLETHFRQLFGLGAALMISAVLVHLSELTVRSLVGQRLGLAELGLYQAAATISFTYLTFILQAMNADFYPRLSALPAGSEQANLLINEQTEITLLLGGPVILAMTGVAPWALSLLYTSEFAGAAAVLRWQLLADILRLASFPLGFALLAAGRGRIFVTLEIAGFGTLVAGTYGLIPFFGVESAGIALLAMYCVYLPLALLAVRAGSHFRWSGAVWRDLALLCLGGGLLMALAAWNSSAAAFGGLALAATSLALAFNRVRHLLPAGLAAKLGRKRA